MRICYVDEAGDARDLPPKPPHGGIAPVLVVAGLVVNQAKLEHFTRAFIALKARWYPDLIWGNTQWLGRILHEVKGADIRRALRDGGSRNRRRQAIGFLDALMALIEDHEMRIFGRVWIKQPGAIFDDQAVYTFSVQAICANFEKLLEASEDTGLVLADSRLPTDNARVAHSIFTQKFRTAGDWLPTTIGDAQLRPQPEPRRAASRGSCLLCAAVPDGYSGLLHGSRCERPCGPRVRRACRPIRQPPARRAVPVQRRNSLAWWLDRVRPDRQALRSASLQSRGGLADAGQRDGSGDRPSRRHSVRSTPQGARASCQRVRMVSAVLVTIDPIPRALSSCDRRRCSGR